MQSKIIAIGLLLSALLFFKNAFEVSASTYGSNFLTGGTASASSEQYGVASNLVDNNITSYWYTGPQTSMGWWKYDLGTSTTKTIGKLDLWFYADACPSGHVNIKNFDIQGSNDNVNYYNLGNGTSTDGCAGGLSPASPETYIFTPSSTAYRYIKLKVNNSWTADVSPYIYNGAMEIKAYECTDCGGSSSATSTPLSSSTERLSLTVNYLLDLVLIVGVSFGLVYFIRRF